MGFRLAEEIKATIRIKTYYEEADTIKKISFISHSLGGVIVRAALPYLKSYNDKFFTFLSIGSP
jgi:hypothetical protein